MVDPNSSCAIICSNLSTGLNNAKEKVDFLSILLFVDLNRLRNNARARNVEGTRKMITTLFRHGEKAVTKYENETGEKVDFLDTGFELLKHIGSYTKFVETMVRMYFENIVALFFLFFSVLL
jgi:hypothetical protein